MFLFVRSSFLSFFVFFGFKWMVLISDFVVLVDFGLDVKLIICFFK